jgi:hypothetical protein
VSLPLFVFVEELQNIYFDAPDGAMTTKFTDFKKTMISEITDFIKSQAHMLSVADINRLIVDLPALRKRFAKIRQPTCPYLIEPRFDRVRLDRPLAVPVA